MTDTKTDDNALADLIQLPDGNWIELVGVIGARYSEPTPEHIGAGIPAVGHRILVDTERNGHFAVPFSDMEAAVEFRDELARKANAAKAAARQIADSRHQSSSAWSDAEYTRFLTGRVGGVE